MSSQEPLSCSPQFLFVEGLKPTRSTSPNAATTKTVLQSMTERLSKVLKDTGCLTEMLSSMEMAGCGSALITISTGATDNSPRIACTFLGGEFEDRNSLPEPGTY